MKLAQTKAMDKSIALNRFTLFNSELDRILTLSMGFSIVLVMARIAYTGRFTFIWLIWNLVLAWIPYVITSWLQQRAAIQTNRLKFAAVCLVWLLFIPNSFYILTDLTLIISFAWNGLLLGILSVRQMEKIMQPHLPGKHELFFIYPIMWLNALGVYIGRYPRFNSWDILTNPFELINYLIKLICHPIQWKYAWGMVACFSIFMTLVYLAIKRLSKAIH
jgi:uncharacterized membrane protein